MKRMPTKRLLAALTVTTALVAAPAAAQLFSDWDWDENGLLTEEEFVSGAEDEGLFEEWDDNGDGRLTQSEFRSGLYEAWDYNDNGRLSVNEWDRGVDSYLGEGAVNLNPDNWDANGDGVISRAEFRDGMDDINLFAALEANRDDDEFIGMAGGAQQAAATGMSTQQPLRNQQRGNRVVSLRTWDYENLRGGFSGENLMDADVYSSGGEEIGEVENIILGPDNAIQSLIVEVGGGFLGFGDTELAIPWNDARIRMSGNEVDGVTIPVTADNYERYSVLGEYGYGLREDEVALGQGISQVYRVDDAETAGGAWRASNLMGDYVSLADNVAYGYVDDLIFSEDGVLQSVVVQSDAGYGTGPYAYPFYGYDYGFDPATDYYGLPYGYGEVGAMDPFDYGILDPGI